jgi:hypothetical protein
LAAKRLDAKQLVKPSPQAMLPEMRLSRAKQ